MNSADRLADHLYFGGAGNSRHPMHYPHRQEDISDKHILVSIFT